MDSTMQAQGASCLPHRDAGVAGAMQTMLQSMRRTVLVAALILVLLGVTGIHFCHTTIHGCGWSGARRGANGAVHLVHVNCYALHFRGNIIASSGEPYLSGWSDKVIYPSQARNLWCGAGAPPTWDLAAIGAEPRFVDAAHDDFGLQPNSPAVDAGVDTGVRTDFDGIPRSQGATSDLGAHE